MDPKPAPAGPAASVLLLRPAESRFEVLMVHRRGRGFFGGLVVFPGGTVDAVDSSDLARAVVAGTSEDRAHRAAAIRELAEETGILVSSNEAHRAPDGRDSEFYEGLLSDGVEVDGESLVMVSRWVTPEPAPRRFDTRFYVVGVGQTPPVRLDEEELTGFDWVTPAEALDRHRYHDWSMVLPTLAHLRWLDRRTSVADALETARGAEGRTLVEPRRMEDGSIVPLLLPAEQT